jgi:hypothetical protein
MEQTPRRRHELPAPSPSSTTRPALDKLAGELWTSKADSLPCLCMLDRPSCRTACIRTHGHGHRWTRAQATGDIELPSNAWCVCALLCREFGASPVARAVSLPCHGPVGFGPARSSLSGFSFLGHRQRQAQLGLRPACTPHSIWDATANEPKLAPEPLSFL